MMARIIEALFRRPVIRVFFFLLFTLPAVVFAQQNFDDTDLLSPDFHKQRRDSLRAILPADGCAVVFANPVRNRTNDVDYQYVQDPDLYYLTGLTEPHAVLFLFSKPVKWEGSSTQEILFIQDRDPEAELWTGKRAGIDYVKEKLGIKSVGLNFELDKKMPPFTGRETVWVKWPSDIGKGTGRKDELHWMVAKVSEVFQDKGLDAKTTPLATALASLREIKQKDELVLMQKAIDMTVEGLAEAIRAARPEMTEYQAQAVVEFYFKHRGAEYQGYGSISGGGRNSCVLHYTTNRKRLKDGDMLLMDMGAEYHGYTADITRTIPVNGRFSTEQKAIYELVLKAQSAGIDSCLKGSSFHSAHLVAQKIIAEGLVALGVITDLGDARKYFPHGTSHYLGLEVHDAGNYGPLQPGMVITVEPGIYIPEGSPCDKKWWNIGVRIEDDILITDNQPVIMSRALPRTVQELEKLMAEPSLFESVK